MSCGKERRMSFCKKCKMRPKQRFHNIMTAYSPATTGTSTSTFSKQLITAKSTIHHQCLKIVCETRMNLKVNSD